MEAAVIPATQLWDKATNLFIFLAVAPIIAITNIHNEIAVLGGSFLVLVLVVYTKTVVFQLEYASFKRQLTLLAGFMSPAVTILLMTVFARLFSNFVAESGSLTVQAMIIVFVVFVVALTSWGILSPYLWLYRSFGSDIKK